MLKQDQSERFNVSAQAIQEHIEQQQYDRTDDQKNPFDALRLAAGNTPSYYYTQRGIGVA